MAKQQAVSSITALPQSPTEDRHNRMRNYLIAMGIRLACVLLCFVVQGPWLWVFAIGALVLPYLAVVLANAGRSGIGADVLRPGSIVPVRREDGTPDGEDER